jgi:carboxypeptidase family protein
MRIQAQQPGTHRLWAGILSSLLCASIALGQAATGNIRGAVTDPNGEAVSNATVTVKNVETGLERKLTTNSEGLYTADSLQPGEYEVTAQAQGFQRTLRRVTVLTGTNHAADFALTVGRSNETVTITSDAAQLNTSEYKIDGVVTRERVEALPLNGRNFLELAQLEPGVTVRTVSNPGALANSFSQVQIAGVSGALTRISVDGASVNDRVTGGSATNFSQESVQEFQISTFNFDLATSVTGVGSVNIVSRTGTNTLHGSGFFFFRDHNLSAYPNLNRSASNPDPFFARRQSGFSIGGPAKKDKLFWFTNFEYNNQLSVSEISLTRTTGDGGAFANTYNHIGQAPLRAKLFNARLDYKVSDKHNSFFRYSEEHNRFIGFNASNESTWNDGENNAYNAVIGLTSVLSPRMVNDLRLNYNFLASALGPPTAESCGDSIGCLGAAGPFISVLGTGFNIGTTSGLPTDRANRTYQITDTLSLQLGAHRVRIGGEFEKYVRFGSTATQDTGLLTLFGPEQVRTLNPTLYAALPARLKSPAAGPLTLADILRLPVASFSIGVGDYSSPAPFNREQARRTNRYRLFYQDGWQMRPSFTFNYGLAWAYESNLRNYDLPRPQYLAPILGGGENLEPPPREYKNFSPAIGFAWALGKEKKTVIRGGSGLYWDSDIGSSRIAERRVLGPSGNGRVVVQGSGIANPLFGQVGQPLTLTPSPALPTALNGQQVLNLIPQIKASEEARFGRLGDLSLQNIQRLKANDTQPIFSHDTRTPYNIHVTFGAQREIVRNMTVTADFIMRRGVAFGGPHTIFDVDLNHFNQARPNQAVDPITQVVTFVRNPVIPDCAVSGNAAASLSRRNDPSVQCSVGAISVFQSASNTRYVGLHLKLDKRFANRYQFTASYALSRYNSWNGITNLNNWHESYGINDGDRPHRLNFSGIWEAPEYKGGQRLLRGLFNGWQFSTISQFQSAPPLNPTIATTTFDADGDGTNFFALPGIKWNEFGRGADADDIRRAVADYNASVIAQAKPLPANATAAQIAACNLIVNGQRMCGRRSPQNQVFPLITLPENFSSGDTLLTTDLRVTRLIKIKEKVRLSLIGEVFNIFNIANLGTYTGNLQSESFGIPTTRTNQVFGSGGPRAFQLAAKIGF